ncbi:MAG: hypothetical protein KF866_03490 [Phycisphaeraceae bacterium]|nr:hypothetical protein [Phycisphaeraceae bacterium]MCW5753244.1 hypothetical protein [Phycisphaeraceae bacterium]
MLNRWHLTIALVAVALVCLTIVTIIKSVGGEPVGDTLTEFGLNLGAEIIGIAMTVAVVDWLIERSKLREEAQRIAWATLHDIDHAVWVWQGGRREFHLDELVAILSLVKEEDPLPVFTKNLFANLGMRASDTLRLQARVFRHHRKLKNALTYLSGLAQIRELENLVSPSYIVQSLQSSVAILAFLTGQGMHPASFGIVRTFRDPSIDGQQARYRGVEVEALSSLPPLPNTSSQVAMWDSRTGRIPPRSGISSAQGIDNPSATPKSRPPSSDQ